MTLILVHALTIIVKDNYLGETGKRIAERITYHNSKDNISYFFKHAVVHDHRNASYDVFKIVGSGFRKNTFKRKFADAILIKELRSNLNIQEKSIELKLFNQHLVPCFILNCCDKCYSNILYF